jgi:outer membrane receptor protein involved in Fe transport
MQGQSDHLANLQFGWEQPDTGSQAMLLVGYGSERIAARGRPAQPDILFDPGTMVDFVARRGMRWGDTRVTLGFEARNLLGEDYREYQVLGASALDINRYALGQSYSVSLTVAF